MKKSDWNLMRIFFLAVTIVIIGIAVFVPDNNITNIIIPVLAIVAMVILDKQAPKVAKLSSDNPKIKTMRNIIRMSISIMILVVLFVELKPLQGNLSKETKDILEVGAVSLFMMVFGNIAPKIPFNRYAGFRLPWTVRDEDTWKLAHKILGYTSFPLAIIQFILIFFFKTETIVTICIALWILIPGAYSGWFYYNKFRIKKYQ